MSYAALHSIEQRQREELLRARAAKQHDRMSIRTKMRAGKDTRTIASEEGLSEAEVWNRLARSDNLGLLQSPEDAA